MAHHQANSGYNIRLCGLDQAGQQIEKFAGRHRQGPTLQRNGVDVEGQGGQQFSQEMLLQAVRRAACLHAPEMFSAILAEIQQFSISHEFSDDVCLVGMEASENL